jgi:hypothetical protein
MRRRPTMHALNLGKFDSGVKDLLLDFRFGEVATGVGADIHQPVPFVHAKLSHAHFNVQSVVVILDHVALGQMLPEHISMDVLAPLNLCD